MGPNLVRFVTCQWETGGRVNEKLEGGERKLSKELWAN